VSYDKYQTAVVTIHISKYLLGPLSQKPTFNNDIIYIRDIRIVIDNKLLKLNLNFNLVIICFYFLFFFTFSLIDTTILGSRLIKFSKSLNISATATNFEVIQKETTNIRKR
jgi:hypothetical protein